MTMLGLFELLMVNLRQELPNSAYGYVSKEDAYEMLKELTGQDFGNDTKAWGKWLKKNKKDPYRKDRSPNLLNGGTGQ